MTLRQFLIDSAGDCRCIQRGLNNHHRVTYISSVKVDRVRNVKFGSRAHLEQCNDAIAVIQKNKFNNKNRSLIVPISINKRLPKVTKKLLIESGVFDSVVCSQISELDVLDILKENALVVMKAEMYGSPITFVLMFIGSEGTNIDIKIGNALGAMINRKVSNAVILMETFDSLASINTVKSIVNEKMSDYNGTIRVVTFC